MHQLTKRFIIIISGIFCFSLFTAFRQPGELKGKTILAVFAHPDDEAAIGPILVKYGKTNKVYLITLTDGRYGVRKGFPTGDTLAQLRQTETACACKLMGVQPPVFFGFTDGFDTRIGVGKYMEQSKVLKEKLIEKIKELNPDLVITFGPDGDTGHSDHRMAGNMTTEVILQEGWVEKYPLYYLGWTKKDDLKFKMIGGLNTVDEKYLNVSVSFSDAEELQAMKALDCYKSQLSAEEIAEWKEAEKKDVSNTLYFRELTVAANKKIGF